MHDRTCSRSSAETQGQLVGARKSQNGRKNFPPKSLLEFFTRQFFVLGACFIKQKLRLRELDHLKLVSCLGIVWSSTPEPVTSLTSVTSVSA